MPSLTSGRSVTTAHDATPEGGSSAAEASKAAVNRGLLPPPLVWLASASAKAPAVTASSTDGRDARRSVLTTSSSRGRSTNATSEPPAKNTWPLHHDTWSTRCAPNGPISSGCGIDPSDSPPLADAPDGPEAPDARRPAPARLSAAVTMRVTAIGDIALTTTPGGATPTELPRECGDRALGAAVGPGIGRAPTRTRRHADDAAMGGCRHDRQRGAEDVAVAVEVHGEHAAPVVVVALGETCRTADPGDVDDAVEATVLAHEFGEEGAHRVGVGDRRRRRSRRAAGRDDASRGRLLRHRELLGTIETDEGVECDDERAAPSELLGNRCADAGATARDDDYLPIVVRVRCAHASSRPSSCSSASHFSSSSR